MNAHFNERQKCPACDGTALRDLYRTPYNKPPLSDYLRDFYEPQGGVEMELLDGADYQLAECDGCGLVMQRQIPDDFLLEKLYESWIDPQKQFDIYERDHEFGHYRFLGESMLLLGRFFESRGRRPASLKFLDFGMGWGDWCRMAMAFGHEVYGSELSEKRIAHARGFGIKIVDFESIPAHQFNFINCEQVFEHVPNALQMLRHLAKGLCAGGIIRISVPDGSDIHRRLKTMNWTAPKFSADSLNAVAPLEHLNCFSHRSLISLGKGAGLRLAEIEARERFSIIKWRPITPLLKQFLRRLEPPPKLNVGTCLFFERLPAN